ncbi:MAG: RnfABCDGE type electron transport complex subunit D [Spirochaetes bacterium]|nr:RnfABCDGE type electron transport complex subunit D [Spirochaetota bacterium]
MINNKLIISSSPHVHHKDSTSRIMLDVIIALIPAGIWAIYVFGMRSFTVIAVSIIAAVVAEYVMIRVMKKGSIGDFSAILTGLLIGYNMPTDVPLYVAAIASIFAILVVKWAFGGLGTNIMNPALAGRCFVLFSWTGAMTTWRAPVTNPDIGLDALAGASPLGVLQTSLLDAELPVMGPLELLADYPISNMAASMSEWFTSSFGLIIHPHYFDLFFGNVSGSLGEVSALLLIVGGIYLFIRRVITWEIPMAYIVSFGLFVWIFDGLRFGQGFFSGDVAFHILSGGLLLGALFMATDMVTSPLTPKGQIVFGIGCGFLTFLIRAYGSLPEGVSLAIIIMNILVAMIDRFTGPKLFGFVPKEKKK